jgi:hypothetical protein
MMADYPVPLLEPQVPQMVIYRLVKAHGPINRVMMYPFALNFIALLRKIEQIIKIHITELYIIIAYHLLQMPDVLESPVIPVLKNPINHY